MSMSTAPILVSGLPAYYQGRPNAAFIERFGTPVERHVRTSA
jgi:hypothetical protein